jgi:hypothetical protein
MKNHLHIRSTLALACLCAAPTFAANWQIFAATNSDKAYFFFDSDTVVKQGDAVTVWIKYVKDQSFPDSDGSYATAMREIFTCSKRTTQVLTSVIYDKTGNFIKTYTNPGKPEEIIPDSVSEGMLKAICTPDFPKNKSRDLYFPATDNDVFKHAASLFDWRREKNTDPAPK